MGRRADNKANKRQRLILGASAEFASRGFEAATVDGIVRHANVARGTFYLYFPDKLTAFEAVADLWTEPMEGLLSDVAGEVAAARTYEELVAVWKGMATGFAVLALRAAEPLTIAFREIRGTGPAAVALQARERRIVGVVVAFTADAAHRGLLRARDPRLAAWVVLGAVERLVWEALRGDLVAIDGVADEVVAWFEAAFRPG